MIVADTDVLIDYLEDRPPGAEAVARALRLDQLQTTAINCFELVSGARRPREGETILQFLESILVLPLDVEAERRGAEVGQQLESSGAGIGMGDSLIAGIVLASGVSLLTRNERQFERVHGLSLAEIEG